MGPSSDRNAAVRVLVVDAEPDAAESLALLLRLRGHDALAVVDEQRALELAKRDPPSCMLLHVPAPGGDGYRVASRIRRASPGPLVLIAVVDRGREGEGPDALDAGFDHHFIRPVDREGLDLVLEAVDAAARTARRQAAGAGPGADTPSEAAPLNGAATPPRASRVVEVADPLGLHLRPANAFVVAARRFASDVRIRRGDRWVNGKSILDIATLAAACGDRLELEAVGPDAGEALAALADLIAPPARHPH